MKKKKQKNKKINTLTKEVNDFKKFISRGNVVDMAVGVIVGGAFGKIVSSLVNDILMPLIGILLGGLNFSDLSVEVGNANIKYGIFVQTIIDFLIISFSIFVMIKLFERFKKKEEPEQKNNEKSEEVKILEQIRDIMEAKHE